VVRGRAKSEARERDGLLRRRRRVRAGRTARIERMGEAASWLILRRRPRAHRSAGAADGSRRVIGEIP
jgi:hypothetical protein